MRYQKIVLLMIMCLLALIWIGIPSQSTCQAQSESGTLVWSRPVQVTRPARKARPRRHVERKPLLTLEWRMIKRGSTGEAIEETNPLSTFHTGDQFRFVVRPNQDGYLYVFNHSESLAGQMLGQFKMIFPDSDIDGGRNFIRKDREYAFPPECPTCPDPREWFEVVPPDGHEVFTVIFSRDLISDLLSARDAIEQQRVIENLKRFSGQILDRRSRPRYATTPSATNPYAIWITNTNARNNEELIDSFVIRHETEK